MYTHANFHTVLCACTCAWRPPISQATYIRSEKFKKWTPPNIAVGNGQRTHSGGPKAQPNPPGGATHVHTVPVNKHACVHSQ